MEINFSRRAILDVSINGHSATDYVAPALLDFSYTENAEGKADEMQLTLHDREGNWSGPWAPYKGSDLVASFTVHDWDEAGHSASLNCGSFIVDELELSGPPRKVNIKAVSASLSSGLRETTKTQAWENASLNTLASDIASRNGLTLDSKAEAAGIHFQRIDQREESDLAFLNKICRAEGLSVRVRDGKLELYNAAQADAQAPGLVVQHSAAQGGTLVPTSYTLRVKSAGTAYTEAEVSYTDPSAGLTHEAQIMLNNVNSSTLNVVKDMGSNVMDGKGFSALKQGYAAFKKDVVPKVLRLNERVESDAAALRRAKAALRSANLGEIEGSMEFMGNPAIRAGITLQVQGFGSFDGIYFVNSTTHKLGGSYTTSVEIRNTLGY